MKRRKVLAAALALPIAAVVPAIVALPTTTYRYFVTTMLPQIKWVPIKDAKHLFHNEIIAQMPMIPAPGGKLKWMSGKEAFGV